MSSNQIKSNTAESELTAKYSTGESGGERDVNPESVTEFEALIAGGEELSADREDEDEDEEIENRPDPTDDTAKYAHLIDSDQLDKINQAAGRKPHTPANPNNSDEGVPTMSFHAEVRYFGRADFANEDTPQDPREAWEIGVKVGVEHVTTPNFYDYTEARYVEPAGVVLLMKNGWIKTAVNVFDSTVKLNTDHLKRCGNPSCGRLYQQQPDDPCCHWCGYTEANEWLETEPELLPERHAVSPQEQASTPASDDSDEADDAEVSQTTLDTVCEDCGETFETLTRLRLHDCC